jgi:O-antigen ligase
MNLKYVLTIILIFIPILFYSFSNYDYKKDISFNERYSVKELSDMSGRMAIWESLKTYISKNLITGVGFGNSEKVLYEITDGRNSSTHNLYMGILLESGVIILGLISVLVFTILFDSFKTIIHSLEDKALESGAILSLILGLLVQEMGEFMLIRIHAVNFILILFISFLSKLSTQKNISKAFL